MMGSMKVDMGDRIIDCRNCFHSESQAQVLRVEIACNMAAKCFERLDVRASLLAASQRNETPHFNRASATGGRTVSKAAGSTNNVSTLLHAAGYVVLESTTTLTAIVGSAVCSRYITHSPSACPSTGIFVEDFI